VAGILLIIINPNAPIAYTIALTGIGGYLFAVGLTSTLLAKMYYKNTSEEAAPRIKLMRIIEIAAYSIIGIIMAISIILCFTVLK